MELVHVISLIEDFIQYGLHTGNIVRAGSVRAGSVRAGSVQGTLEVQTFFDLLVVPGQRVGYRRGGIRHL